MLNNNWVKPLIIPLIALVLSVGTSVFVSGKTTGGYTEKVDRAERDIEQLKSDYKSDHDIVIRMDTKLTNIESMLKDMKEKMDQK